MGTEPTVVVTPGDDGGEASTAAGVAAGAALVTAGNAEETAEQAAANAEGAAGTAAAALDTAGAAEAVAFDAQAQTAELRSIVEGGFAQIGEALAGLAASTAGGTAGESAPAAPAPEKRTAATVEPVADSDEPVKKKYEGYGAGSIFGNRK